ncbi:ATPase [soil metagenome]
MTDSDTRPINVICLATYFKGVDFILECKSRGCQVVLITKEKMLGEDWPRESLDDLIALPNDAGPDLFIHLLSLLARQTKIDRIVALEEFDVIIAAQIREHFCLSGMSSATARLFRDKLAMGAKVKEAGIKVPDFVALLNHDEVRDFVDRVPPPWVIKPRSDVSAIGIKKGREPGDVWSAIDELDRRERLQERSPYHLLSRFISGDVFHVDSLVSNARVIFAGANKYGRPPMDVAHKGGAYISHTIPRGTDDEKKLFAINRKLLKTLGLETGAAHAEFIRSTGDGDFYFLEVAARVGGAYIADVLEASSGVNLWREWARLELADKPTRGNLSPPRKEYAGIVLSLAKQEYPDTTSYDAPEVVYRVKKKHHAGLIVRSKKLERVQELLTQYATRFAEDFEAVLPPLERAE